jgi:hypothetical protein
MTYRHVSGNSACLPWTIIIVNNFVFGEDLQRGVATDRVFGAGVLSTFGTINLS